VKYLAVERTEVGKETVCITVETREHAVVRRVRITAGSIERALSMAGQGRPVSPFLPTDAGRSSTPEGISSCAAFAEVV